MKTKKKLYNFGGPGDDEAKIVARYNKTVPGLKEQQEKDRNWATKYLKNQPTELQLAKEKLESDEYNAAEYLRKSQEGRSSQPTKENPQGLATGQADAMIGLDDPILNTILLAPLAGQLGKVTINNVHRLNPWAFKSNPEAYYRGIGKEGIDDILSSGVVKSKKSHAYPEPYFSKGRFSDAYAKGYVAELTNEPMKGVGAFVDGDLIQTPINKINLQNPNLKLYEQDWLRGYKEVPKPAAKTTYVPTSSSQLPKDLEPYLSKKVIPATKEEEVFNSFLSTQGQAKEIMKRTKKYDPNGKEILEYGGQLKKKFYAFGSNSTNTVGAPTIKPEKNINTVPSSYTNDFSNKTRSKPSFDMGVPPTKFNQSGYIGAATAAATGIANTVNAANNAPDKQTKDNAITYGTVDTTMNVVGSIFPVVGAIEGAADAGKSVVDSTNPTTTVIGDDGKTYSFKEGKSGDNAAAWSASYNPVGNISNFIGDISGSTENYGRSDFGMALGDLFLPFVTEGLRNQDAEEAYNKSVIPNYTSGDSSMKAYAFGGPMPILPKGVNPINKFTDFKDSTFKTHKEKGVGITPNDEVEKNESMYRFGRTKKATGGSSDGGYVFSHILGEDEQGNVSVVPQGSKAPKGWKSYADMSREAMS